MENEIAKILKSAQAISPNPEFQERSRRLICVSSQFNAIAPRRSFYENLKLGFAIALASFAIFAALGGYFYPRGESLSSINSRELLKEMAGLDFKIQLGEVSYFDASAKEIAALLEAIEESN